VAITTVVRLPGSIRVWSMCAVKDSPSAKSRIAFLCRKSSRRFLASMSSHVESCGPRLSVECDGQHSLKRMVLEKLKKINIHDRYLRHRGGHRGTLPQLADLGPDPVLDSRLLCLRTKNLLASRT
jgi:hypothetical protein